MNTFDAELQRDPSTASTLVQLENAHVVLSDEKSRRALPKRMSSPDASFWASVPSILCWRARASR